MAQNKLDNHFKLLVAISAIVLIILLFFNYIFFSSQLNEDYELQSYRQIRILVNPFMNRIKENYHNLNTEVIQKKLQEARNEVGFEAWVTDLDGRILFPETEESQQISLNNKLHYDIKTAGEHEDIFRISFPLIIDDSQQGSVIFELPRDMIVENRGEEIIIVLAPWIITILLIILGLLLIKKKLNSRYLKPLERLNQEADRISRGSYEQEIKQEGSEKLKELSSSLDKIRKSLKETLQQKNKTIRSKNELIASISHDLKTPLATIQASIEGLRDGKIQDENKIDKYYQVIYKKNQAVINMIDDLLIQAKKELSQLEINRKEIYSRNFLESVLNPLQLQYSRENTIIINKPLPDVLLDIDPEKMEQAINNLLENAVKYSAKESTIEVEAGTTEEVFKLYISDNGYGIPEEEIPYIFDRFYRGRISETQNIEGSGLGLWSCKQIIEAHQGSITVDSREEGGTNFTIILPLN